jgi:hypothetical protein
VGNRKAIPITTNSQAQRTDWFRMAAAVTPSRRIISKRARGRFRSSLLTVANRNKPAKKKVRM